MILILFTLKFYNIKPRVHYHPIGIRRKGCNQPRLSASCLIDWSRIFFFVCISRFLEISRELAG